jgi:hypothetical protein
MLRKFCLGFLFLALVLPGASFAGGYAAPTTEDLLQRIDQLTQELQKVKQQLQEVQANQRDQGQDLYDVKAKQQEQTEIVADVEKGLDDLVVDGIGRFDLWGDYRFRVDSTYLHQPTYWDASTMMATGMPTLKSAHDPDNDTIYTNRFRLNLQIKPSDNLTFKARLAMYKMWGMGSDYAAAGNGIFPTNLMTNNMTYGVRPSDATVIADRAYVNWTNIGGLPVWFSVGRRPTTHTLPTQFREGLEGRDATPFGANIDIPFDGLTLGYQYDQPLPGRVRFCYGRGFDSGFKDMGQDVKLDDVDFYGFVWDVIDDPRNDFLFMLQTFKAGDIFDFPEGKIYLNDPTLPFGAQEVSMNTRTNLGDIYEIGGVVQHTFRGINWFASGGMSITDSKAASRGIYQDPTAPDPFEGVGLLSNPGEDLDNHTGWNVYAGARFPIDVLNSKFGLEYNYGSRYWMPFMVASDDLYMNKLSARGHVAEAYLIWDLPETPLSKYAKAFMRFGYQHYWFDYTGSGNWLGKPIKIDDLSDDPMNAQLFTPIERMYNLYATFEVFF